MVRLISLPSPTSLFPSVMHIRRNHSSVSSCESGTHFKHLLLHKAHAKAVLHVKAPGQEFILSTSLSTALTGTLSWIGLENLKPKETRKPDTGLNPSFHQSSSLPYNTQFKPLKRCRGNRSAGTECTCWRLLFRPEWDWYRKTQRNPWNSEQQL